MFSRRDLFRGAASLGALAALPRAAQAAPWVHNLVIVHAYGGWDTTLLFDPKPGSSEVDNAAGDWRQHGDLDVWDAGGMDTVHGFLSDWSDRIAIINGISVNSLVHEECARRILTGTSASAVPDIGARVADLAGRDAPLPYHVVGGNARLHGLEAISGTSGYGNQLSSLVVPDMEFPTDYEALRPSRGDDRLVREYLEARAAGLEAQAGARGSSGVRMQDYAESLERSADIRSGASSSVLSDWELFYSFDAYERAAEILADGFSKAVFLTDDGYWDTHFANGTQPRLYNNLFEKLAGLMETLESSWIAGSTVVMVISEMGRSPLLNGNDGKDHWPYTSAMLIGPGVRSGVVRGTDAGLQQRLVDFSTGQPDEDIGLPIQAQDLLATVTSLVGLDAAELYPEAEVIDAVVA